MMQIPHILVVNINNLAYTRDVVNDILMQTYPYNITVVDQGSTEQGTVPFLNELKADGINICRNARNVELNSLWNTLYHRTKEPFLCFLNNDVRVPRNFVRDTVDIFIKEPQVGIVFHATNHPSYMEVTDLKYKVLENNWVQGWDFTIRREAYTFIPEELKFFGGDDWLFNKAYDAGWKSACAISSPILHYNARSRKYYTGKREVEAAVLKAYNIPRLSYISPFAKKRPQFIWENRKEK